MSHVTYEWVMSRMDVTHLWVMSHVNESHVNKYVTHGCVTSYVYIYMYMYIYISIQTYTYKFIKIYTNIHIYKDVSHHTYIYMYVYIYIHTYIFLCIYTYIHIYIYICERVSCQVWMCHIIREWVMSHMDASHHMWMSQMTYTRSMASISIKLCNFLALFVIESCLSGSNIAT